MSLEVKTNLHLWDRKILFKKKIHQYNIYLYKFKSFLNALMLMLDIIFYKWKSLCVK